MHKHPPKTAGTTTSLPQQALTPKGLKMSADKADVVSVGCAGRSSQGVIRQVTLPKTGQLTCPSATILLVFLHSFGHSSTRTEQRSHIDNHERDQAESHLGRITGHLDLRSLQQKLQTNSPFRSQ